MIIERATGQSFADHLTRQILTGGLGLDDTFFAPSIYPELGDEPAGFGLCNPLRTRFQTGRALHRNGPEVPGSVVGAGGRRGGGNARGCDPMGSAPVSGTGAKRRRARRAHEARLDEDRRACQRTIG